MNSKQDDKNINNNIIPPVKNKHNLSDEEKAEREREVDQHMDDKTTDTYSHDKGPGVGGD